MTLKTTDDDEAFIAAAKEQFEEDGRIEIDEDAPVSRGDDAGAYVQAWVWVSAQLVEEERFETIEYSVCQDCIMFLANGDSPDEYDKETQEEYFKEIAEDIERELNGRKGHFLCGVAPTEDDPEGYGEECFSWHECELCRSTLGGSRHGVTLWIEKELSDADHHPL